MALVVDHVTKNFLRSDQNEDRLVLKQIYLEIEDGEFVSFVGPSGCGKSTLLRIIAGLLKADEGSVSIAHEAVNGPGKERMMVFQDYVLFPWKTVWKNIAMGLQLHHIKKEEIQKKVQWAISLVGLEEFEKAYPHQLSGGMKQRVAIARAIVMNPQFLLMDEPFGALDYFTRINLQDELTKLCQKNRFTTCFVTHDCDEAVYLSDRIVVLSSSPAEVKKIIHIDLPRPRNRNHADFIALRNEVWEQVQQI